MIHLALAVLCPVLGFQEESRSEKPLVESREPAVVEKSAPPWSVGFGVAIYTGFGSVFNDVIGPEFRGSYRFSGNWSVSASVFRSDFDFEDPADNLFGQSGTPVSDASIDLVMVGATARRHFTEPGSAFDLYVGAGMSLAFPSSGEAVNQPQVDIEVEGEAGPEVHLAVGGAARLFAQLHFTVELRLIHSFTEYRAEDRLTGEEESEDGWSGYGLALGLDWRF